MPLRILHHAPGCLAGAFLIAAAVPGGAISYTVEPSDTLYGLAVRYEISVEKIARVNGLDGDVIRPGQVLDIPDGESFEIEIRPGDTLSGLALAFDIPVVDIIEANGLDGDALTVGRRLVIPPPVPDGSYRVRAGDNLTKIARTFGTSPDRLAAYNGLDGDVLRVGQLLLVEAPRPEGHAVGPGESLWSVSKKYGIPMEDLASWNHLAGSGTIHPGDVLVLYPGIESPADLGDTGSADTGHVELAAVDTAARPDPSELAETGLPRDGEYFYSSPEAPLQPNVRYWEGPDSSAAVDYERGREIYAAFRAGVLALPALGSELTGWHVVLDPGHGGLDPGAIVSVTDGNGNPVVVTEDEYAYDIAMRLYRILTRHGASVSLTVLAPDHHIRDGIDARQTFVNRKNEIYNDRRHNFGAAWRPVGTADGLDMRKIVAARTIRRIPFEDKRKGTLFISIHADNSSDFPAGTAVLFDGETDEETERSRTLAASLAPSMGSGSFIRRQTLRVLRSNPADAAVLIEARNVHYAQNAWALRSAELREQDARMMAEGILAWASDR